jgi:hypothetical protein
LKLRAFQIHPRLALRLFVALALYTFLRVPSEFGQSIPMGSTRPIAPAPIAAAGRYRIAGIVVNAITGEPLPRAAVAVLDETDNHAIQSVLSDNEGRFALGHLPEGKFQLTASKRGFLTGFYDEHDEFNTAIVTGPDQETTNLNFRLMPDAVLYGVISTDVGDPVEGARIMLFKRPMHTGPGERIAQVDAAVSDDAGTYEFAGLGPGEYFLAVVAEPWYAMHSAERESGSNQMHGFNPALDAAYPVTYYDSTTEEASATPIVMTGGVRAEANISLHAVPALHLSIAAARKQDGSIARAELQQTIFGSEVSSESAGFLESMQTGSIELTGIAPGQYQLTQGDPPRIVDLDLTASERVDPDAGSPASSVVGTLRMASGVQTPDEVNLTLDRADDGRGLNQLVTVARNGRFKFDSVTPGSWRLRAESGGKMLTVVATSSGSGVHSESVLTMRDRTFDIGVILNQGETQIEGFALKNGKGLAGAMVLLAPGNRANWEAMTRRDQSDSDGSFALRDVSPGQYTLIAIEDGWTLDWTRPEVMARYLAAGTAVTVAENSGQVMQLQSPVTVQSR